MPTLVVWILVIAFWTPGADQPTKIEHDTFVTNEICDAMANSLDREWESRVKGGSTSWACFGAYPQPTS